MDCKIKNDIGTIYITEDVCSKSWDTRRWNARHRRHVLQACQGWHRRMAGKGKPLQGRQIRSVGDMLDVDLFIIVEYGISIAEVCKTMSIPCATSWKA